MKDLHSEKQAKVYTCVIFVPRVKSLESKYLQNEAHLNNEQKHCYEKDIYLILRLKPKFFFVLVHESEIRDGVDILV